MILIQNKITRKVRATNIIIKREGQWLIVDGNRILLVNDEEFSKYLNGETPDFLNPIKQEFKNDDEIFILD